MKRFLKICSGKVEEKEKRRINYTERIYPIRLVLCSRFILFRKRYRLISTLFGEIFKSDAISLDDKFKRK